MSLIATLLVLQGLASYVFRVRATAQGAGIRDRALQSIEQLARVERDIDQELILVDQHIDETGVAAMAALEESIARVAADLGQAEVGYAPLVELPDEADSWQRIRTLLVPFEDLGRQAIVLSRSNRDVEARARFDDVMDRYMALHREVLELIEINRKGAEDKIHQIAAIERRTEALIWGTRIFAFVAILLLAGWGARVMAANERQRVENGVLEQRNRDLDAFGGRVAHDLKNVLEPLEYSAAMIRRGDSNPAMLRIADRIERSSRRANATLDALRGLSRGARDVRTGEVARLREAIEGALEELALQAAEGKVELEVGEIPDVRVCCDGDLLHIVFANLIGNGIKYLAGRPDRRVRVTAHVERSACCVEVEDTGPGIPPWAQEKIFEPFFRLPGEKVPGEGLGLATVHRIVIARGGRIAVDSDVERGARFRVWLPVVPATEKQASPPGEESTLSHHP
jgi:signal transduction histidine kinase